jgi:cobalt-zinc-cadmium efflux system membrane fusion protein
VNRALWVFEIVLGAAGILMLAGCGGKANGEAADGGIPSSKPEAAAASAPASAVEVEPAMLQNLRVETVKEGNLPQLLRTTGKVQFNDDRTARVLAPLPGQVMDLRVRVGDTVEKDEVIFSIKSREVTGMANELLDAHRDEDLAAKTYAMNKDLFEHQAASRISLQQAEGDLAKAKAHVARAAEALRVLGIDVNQVEQSGGVHSLAPVRAPAAGTVIDRPLTPGQFVQADSTPLITIADLSTVWVLVDVFERDIHLVREGQHVRVTAEAYPDRHFEATVARIGDKVDPDSRTLKVRLLVSNPGLLLKPEMFLTATLALSQSSRGLTVPAKARFTEGDRGYVFVATGERTFERRAIEIAGEGEDRLRVVSGVQSGDRVVTDGALLLRFRQKQTLDK